MPKRLPFEVAILAALLASSCDDRPTFRVTDADRIAALEDAVNQHARASRQMVDRVEQLETRVDRLESQVRRLQP